MKFKDVIVSEEKVRLDPKCWSGKKIGNPKTKMKGGVRVNNCVPAESVEEAANPAQQAAIAIAKKKKPGVTEGAQVDSLATDALRLMKGPEVSDAVAALKTVLGDREYNSRRGFYNFYVKQIGDMYNKQGVAEAEGITRRGFLQGAGAAAVAGAAGGVATKANAQQVSQWVRYATDLANKTLGGRLHQETGYDLRNWVTQNVSNWVTNYCNYTNSYNAKEVIDYCNRQGLDASGLDKQNVLVTAFLTNMKDRYQDFLTAYRASINDKLQEFNQIVQSQKQEKTAMGNLNKEDFSVLLDALIIYAICKDRQLDDTPVFKSISTAISTFIKSNNAKDYVNSVYPKARQSVDAVKAMGSTIYNDEANKYFKNAGNTIQRLNQISTASEPEFKESVNQGVSESFNGEYDDEAGMAQGNLYTIAKAAQGLLDTIDDHDNLPEWAQEKIAKVEGMLVTVWNYLQSQKAQGIDPQVDEGEVKPFAIPDDRTQGNYENMGYRKSLQDRFAVIDYTFNKLILTTNDIKQAKQEAIEWAEYDDIPVAVKNQQTNKVVFKLNGYADAEKYLDESVDREIVEMYEAMQNLVSEMAQKTNVSEDVVWETFESLDDNILYETAAWQKKSGKNKNGGLNAKGVASYRREHPGSKLQTAVTTKPSKLKPGSKAAKRRKSFCARMSGVKGPMKKPNGKPTRKALALRKWNC